MCYILYVAKKLELQLEYIVSLYYLVTSKILSKIVYVTIVHIILNTKMTGGKRDNTVFILSMKY